MRKDMSKVIVERPRIGRAAAKASKPGRTRVVTDDDGEPLRVREPKQKPRKTKMLNENLSPLKRFLSRNVGRSWNKVYSEISENLKPSSTVQQHVRDHVQDFVATKTRMRNGKVFVHPWRFGGEESLEASRYVYFVHPRTGLLKRNPHYKTWQRAHRDWKAQWEKARLDRLRIVDAKTQLHLLSDGAWWEVKLAKIGDGTEPDVVLRAKLSTLHPEELYGNAELRAASKRQLNKTEKKKLGLA